MEPEIDNKSATEASDTGESVSFSDVTAVVTGWTFDFMFVSLCRRFKEGKLDEFSETLSTFEGSISAESGGAISQSPSLKGKRHTKKTMICAFIARVMHGKQLDTQFEEDARVTPLMSATKIWSNLEDTVADKSLFKTVNILLVVQSVAVCMEKGQRSSASFALKWLENNHGFPQNVGVKLTRIVTQKETYHPLLVSFSFNRLLETVQSFLDAYLEKDPSDYLLKAAAKVVQSSQNMEGFEDVVTQDSSLSLTANESPVDKKEKENTVCLRTKRKLLSTKIADVWKPDTCKKPFVSVKRLSETECEQKQKKMFSLQPPELSQRTSENSVDTLKNETKSISRKPREKWTPQLDKYLKDGVKLHGTGKWSRILMDYDFEGRSGTMLKDRWRVLMRAHEVG